MSVSNETNKVRFDGDNSTVNFDFSFKVFAESDLKVYVIDANGNASLKVLNTDYTVNLNTVSEGGTVTMSVAPTSTEDLLIRRDLAYTQPTVIPTESNIPETQLENSYDRNTLLIQQVKEITDRSAKTSETSSIGSVTMPDPVADRALVWDGTSGTLKNSSFNPDATGDAEAAATAAEASATAAAASAATAATAAEGLIFGDVETITSSGSPEAIVDADSGKLFLGDTSSGSVIFNLPEISTLDLSVPWTIGIKKTSASNTLTINRGGSDTINGGTSLSITKNGAGYLLIPKGTEWSVLAIDNPELAGAAVGTSDTQTLSNKSYSDHITMDKISAPSTPSSGKVAIYPKSDGKLYIKDDAGTESTVGDTNNIYSTRWNGSSLENAIAGTFSVISSATTGVVILSFSWLGSLTNEPVINATVESNTAAMITLVTASNQVDVRTYNSSGTLTNHSWNLTLELVGADRS